MLMNKKGRNHKVTIFSNAFTILKNVWFLAIILITNDVGFSKLLLFSLALAFLIFVGLLQWYNTYYYMEEDKLCYIRGIVNKNNIAIPIDKISTIDLSQNIIQRLFNLVTIKVDSGASNVLASEIKIVLTNREAEKLKRQLKSKENKGESGNDEVFSQNKKVLMHMDLKDVVLYSFTQNNMPIVLGAVFSLLAFVDDILNFFNLDIDKFINDNNFNFNFAFNLETILKIAAYVGAGLVVSALVSLIIAAFKYSNFSVVKAGANINIEYGLLNTRKYSFTVNKINAVILKQNLLRKHLGLYKMQISIIGYGNEKGEEAILFPISNRDNMLNLIEEINPKLLFHEEIYKANKYGRASFFTLPVIVTFTLCVAGFLLTPFKYWWFVLLPVSFMLRYLKYKNTSLGYNDKMIIATFGTLSKDTVLMELDKVQSLTKKTNYFQRIRNLCTYKLQYYSQSFGGNITLKHLEDKHFKIIKYSL